AVEGFQYAEDLSLMLGLVLDSSGSMDERMIEAKQAAGGFLGQVMKPGDRAFLVDFDTRPRLAHPLTDDLAALFRTFPGIQPEGATAIYDSVVFSILQFDPGRGRKALVILTDGDDYQSRYSPRRAIDDAQEAGVPVYVIALGEDKQARRILKTSDLDSLTEKTGGRVFLATQPGDLEKAYAEINAELRSQYLLTFYTEPDGKDLDVEVLVDRPGVKARTVVGGR
ncbi:MAG: VWA domain-containing protein, partial [Acidobacteria bacterium]|nr:VWA domain-containing protein [Acidobacteriota bacterium]